VTVDGDPGQEPDYRMSLAAERTYLAYLRTGLALLAAGVAVVGALPDAAGLWLRRGVGLLLVIIGGALLASARQRWTAVDRAMRRGEPLPQARVTGYLGWVLSLVAIAAAVLLFVV
jgi:putative membrane protein